MVSTVWTSKRLLRLTGIVSILIALITVAADELLQYSPQGYASYLYYRDIVFWRVLSGDLLGVLAIPLAAIGYWHVCQALKLSGVKRTSLMFWIIAYGAAIGATAHGAFTAVIVIIQEGTSSSLTRALDYLQTYVAIPFGVFLLCYLIVSAWYCIAVLSGRTLYPKWMALLNPFFLSLVIALLSVSNLLPALANVLSPAWLSIPHLVFFTLSTLVLWHPREERLAKTVQVGINA
jgi:hypothetical protein